MLRYLMLALVVASVPILGSNAAIAQSGSVTLEWLSWSIFRLTSPGGKVILTNPFVVNPDSPVTVDDFKKVDYILVSDGHGDEMGQADKIAVKTKAKVLTSHTFATGHFKSRNVPMSQTLRGGPGSRFKLDGMTIRVVNSVHGSTTQDGLSDASAMGFFITFENGLTVYFAGSMNFRRWRRACSATSATT